MSTAVHSLDDLAYADLLADLTARIPGLDRAWTDHSPTEPGMVLLELLCWLTDGVIFRLDQVSPAVVAALLDLLDPTSGPSGPDDPQDEAIARTRASLRTSHRAVTPTDFGDLLAARWPARNFAVHPARNLADDAHSADAAPGHVSIVAAAAVGWWVTHLRLIPRRVARVFPVDRQGPVRVEARDAEDRLVAALVDNASDADLGPGNAWTLQEDPLAAGRRFTLLGPDGRVRAQARCDLEWTRLTIEAGEPPLADLAPALPDAPQARLVWLQPVARPPGPHTLRLWTANTAEAADHDLPAAAPARLQQDFAVAGEALDVVACVACHEPATTLEDDTRSFLDPRILLGTRVHVRRAARVPFTVRATLRLQDGAEPGAARAAAIARLERRFHAADLSVREVDLAAIVALLADTPGVESVALDRDAALVRLPEAPPAPAPPRTASAWQPAAAAPPLAACEVAALAPTLHLQLQRRDATGEWEDLDP